MKCQYCNLNFPENKIQEHHIHPRFMGNHDGKGKKLYLCEKCHNILHLKIPTILWKFISNKEECLKKVIEYSELKFGGKCDKSIQQFQRD